MVGRRIEVFWAADGEWQEGRVLAYNAATGKHTVEYLAHGAREQLTLAKEQWRQDELVESVGSSDEEVGVEDEEGADRTRGDNENPGKRRAQPLAGASGDGQADDGAATLLGSLGMLVEAAQTSSGAGPPEAARAKGGQARRPSSLGEEARPREGRRAAWHPEDRLARRVVVVARPGEHKGRRARPSASRGRVLPHTSTTTADYSGLKSTSAPKSLKAKPLDDDD